MAYKYIIASLVLLVSSVFSAPSVPVLTWWYESGLKVPEQSTKVLSGHSIDQSSIFVKHLKDVLNENKVVLFFQQDQLSIDDFTKFSSAFSFIKESLENHNQLVFPSTSQEKSTLYESIKTGLSNSKVTEVFPEDDWATKVSDLNENGISVYIVHLEPVGDADSSVKEEIFKRNDAFMKSVTTHVLKKTQELSVVYTSAEPSKLVSNMITSEIISDDNPLNSRHLLGTIDNSKPGILRKGDFLMAYKEVNFGDNLKQLQKLNVTGTNETMSFENGTFSFQTLEGYDISITLEERNNTIEWVCKAITLKNSSDFNLTFDCGDRSDKKMRLYTSAEENTIVFPQKYSFSCPKLVFTASVEGDNTDSDGNNVKKNYYLQINGLQLQAKGGAVGVFKDAFSCVGFFTMGILTSLLVVFLLIGALFMGIMLMMNIQTQDRFDDPKGKTITVHTGE